MPETVRGEVVAIGTEMLLGDLVDTNSAFIARELKAIGVNLHLKTVVGDNLERMYAAIGAAHARSHVVITTGGLGPTVDDLTREAVARVMGVELEFRQDLFDYIEAYFLRRGFKMTENNRKQAFVPAGAEVIENPRGTAPCFIAGDAKGVIIAAPGVPHEMRFIIAERAVPYLRKKFRLGEVIRTRVLRTCGLGESRVDEMIGDLFAASANPSIGVLAHPGQVDVRITAKAADAGRAEEMIGPLEAKVRERLGDSIFGTGEVRLEEVVAGMLTERGLTIAVVESNTGGAVIQRLCASPERVRFLRRGIVALEVSELARLFGVPDGSGGGGGGGGAESAEAFARIVRREAGADLGLAIVGPNPPPGIEPEEGKSPAVSGNTYIALDTGSEVLRYEGNFGGNEQFIQARAPVYAFDLIRGAVRSQAP